MKRVVAGIVAALACSAAFAQYPVKGVRLIVPFPPGGGADLVARLYAQPLSVALAQPVIVEHRPGADGAIAGDAVLKAAPDGYTLLFGTATGMSAMPNLRKARPYDPVGDFTPVSLVGTFGFFLFVHPSLPGNTLQELIANVRASPGKFNYGSGNLTSVVTTAHFAALQKLSMLHVPYKGDAPATIDLVAGRVQMMFAAGSVLPQARDGKLRILATMLDKRSALAPEAPTLAEAGLPPLPIKVWGGLFGPAKMPKEITDRLARDMATILARPEVRENMEKLAFEAQSSTPEQLRIFVREQLDVWGRTIREIGLPIE